MLKNSSLNVKLGHFHCCFPPTVRCHLIWINLPTHIVGSFYEPSSGKRGADMQQGPNSDMSCDDINLYQVWERVSRISHECKVIFLRIHKMIWFLGEITSELGHFHCLFKLFRLYLSFIYQVCSRHVVCTVDPFGTTEHDPWEHEKKTLKATLHAVIII